MGKFYLLTAGVGKGNWLLAFTLVIRIVIGLYYYLRFTFVMMETNGRNVPISTQKPHFHLTGVLLLTLLGATTIWLGVFPAWLINLIKALT